MDPIARSIDRLWVALSLQDSVPNAAVHRLSMAMMRQICDTLSGLLCRSVTAVNSSIPWRQLRLTPRTILSQR